MTTRCSSLWQQVLVLTVLATLSTPSALNCTSDPCMYGICVDSSESYSCYCIDGYTGINCEINFDDCWSDPCLNGGSCTDAVAAYNCSCTEGFVGSNCEQRYSECLNQPCLNNGTCVDLNGISCLCQEGYSGDFCEIDVSVCNSTICKNAGECIDGPGYSFTCKCKEGWTGDVCDEDVDECLSSPCLNGGLCLNVPSTYTCACLFGFTGKDCDKAIVSCEVNPCHNNAVCLQEDGRDVCYCVPDYHGSLCELRYDDCASKFAKCENGGTCIDGINSYTCYCPAIFTGSACEHVIPLFTEVYSSTQIYTSTEEAHGSSEVPESADIYKSSQVYTSTEGYKSTILTSSTEVYGSNEVSSTFTPKVPNFTEPHDLTTTEAGMVARTTVLFDVPSTLSSSAEVQTTTGFSTSSTSGFQGRTEGVFEGKSTATDFTTPSTPLTSTSGAFDELGTSSTVTSVFQAPTGVPMSTSTERKNETARDLTSADSSTSFSTSAFTTFSSIFTTSGNIEGVTERRIGQGTMTTMKFDDGVLSSTLPSTMSPSSSTLEGRDDGMVTMISVARPVETTTALYNGGISTSSEESTTRGFTFNCSQTEQNATSCNCTSLEGCTFLPSIKTAAFNGKSYIRQQVNIDSNGTLKIFIQLKTKSKSGIILHAFFDEERYVLLYMEFGQLKFQFSCGLQTMLLGEIDTPINNGNDVDVEIRFRYVAEEKVDKCLAQLYVNNTMAMSGEQMLSTRESIPGSVRLHLGGIPQAFSHYFPRIALGFIGCMAALKINDVQKHFIFDSLETFQIEECTSFLCLLNPCRNFGSCHDIGGKVYCKCIAGYSGELCEKTACDDNPCYLGSTCISSPGTGFICVCPMGMHGLRCEEEAIIVQPSFSVFIPGFASYAAYGVSAVIKDAMELRMRIIAHSVDQISLIAYMGQSSPGGDIPDHFSLTYVKGYIMLTWDLGSGVRRIFTKSPIPSKNHRPYALRVGRRGREAWLFVEGVGNFTGQAAGTMTQLDVSPILYIGGHKSKNFETLPHDLPLHTGFTGCIYDVELHTDNAVFPVSKSSPATGRGVGECHRNECTRNSCKNGAVCLNHGPTYSCICMKEWEGPECNIPSKTCPDSNPLCHKAKL